MVGGAQLKEAHAKEQEAHEELQRTSAEAEERAEADAAAYIAVLRQEAHDAHDAVERLTADLTATKVPAALPRPAQWGLPPARPAPPALPGLGSVALPAAAAAIAGRAGGRRAGEGRG